MSSPQVEASACAGAHRGCALRFGVRRESRRRRRLEGDGAAGLPGTPPNRGLGPVQLQYKPTGAQRAVIDALVAEAGLPDHTKFLAVVLDE